MTDKTIQERAIAYYETQGIGAGYSLYLLPEFVKGYTQALESEEVKTMREALETVQGIQGNIALLYQSMNEADRTKCYSALLKVKQALEPFKETKS